jgi:hypothetical protein
MPNFLTSPTRQTNKQTNKPTNIMKKEILIKLLNDKTICHEIDTSGSASEHELGQLATSSGYASLTSCLNDLNAWGKQVGEVAAWLVDHP